MPETKPTDNQEPSSEEAANIDAGIASGVEIVSDKLPSPPNKPSGNILSSEHQTRNAEEQIQDTRPTDNQGPSSEDAADIDAGLASGVEIVSDKPPPPKTSGNILSAEQQTSNVEEQIQYLKRELETHKCRLVDYDSKLDCLSLDPTGQWKISSLVAGKRWRFLHTKIVGFTFTYGYGYEKLLSESEKQSIIAALDGWCPQESWDYLLEQFSADKYICSRLPSLLAEALLHKHICDYHFTNPFWYFGCSNERKPTQTDDFHAHDSPFRNTFGTQMYNLWQGLLQGNTALNASLFQICTCRSIVERPNMTYLVYFSEPHYGTFMAMRDSPAAFVERTKMGE